MSSYSIYRFVSPSGKSYIGQSLDPKSRYKQHIRNLKKWIKEGRPETGSVKFFRALDKYPLEEWLYSILHEGLLKEEADQIEKLLIMEFDSIKNGYNITPGGQTGGMYGKKHAPETIAKMSEAKKNNSIAMEQVRALGLSKRGTQCSKEAKKKMSEAKLQNPKTMENIQKLAELNRGKPLSNETKAKISSKAKGRTLTPEHRAKLSEARKKFNDRSKR